MPRAPASDLASPFLVGRAARTLASVLLVVACETGEPPPAAPTAPVERRRIERIVVATGTIEPAKEVEVRPRVAGIVEEITVAPGDLVEAGALLVQLDREILEAQVREAEAAVRAADVSRRFAKLELERRAALEARGAAALRDRDDARSRHEGSRAELARMRARLDSLEVQLRYSTIRSPLAGRVLDVHVEEGNAVSPVTAVTGGTLLLSIAATSRMHLEGLVDENEIARVALGQPARIRTEAFPERIFSGTVREISPVGERVQNVTYFEVEIEVDDPDAGALRARMSGDADIVTEVVDDALVVPETALRYDTTGIHVDVVDGADDRAPDPRPVEIGIVDGALVEIVSGVEPGERVRLQ